MRQGAALFIRNLTTNDENSQLSVKGIRKSHLPMWPELVLEEWQNVSLKENWSEAVGVAAQASFTVAIFWEVVLY